MVADTRATIDTVDSSLPSSLSSLGAQRQRQQRQGQGLDPSPAVRDARPSAQRTASRRGRQEMRYLRCLVPGSGDEAT